MIGYAVSLDVRIDLVLIFTVVAQRIKYLSHVQVGQVRRNLFRRKPRLSTVPLVQVRCGYRRTFFKKRQQFGDGRIRKQFSPEPNLVRVRESRFFTSISTSGGDNPTSQNPHGSDLRTRHPL